MHSATQIRWTACDGLLCHVYSNKTLLNFHAREVRSAKLKKENKRTQKNSDIKFEKNLIFKNQCNNSRGIITIPREDSQKSKVGRRGTL